MASIVKRGNKYTVVYYYTDEQGNKQQKWETMDSVAAARKRKAEVEFQQENNLFIAPTTKTVAGLLADYVCLVGKKKWALSTYTDKQRKIENYITPYIGDLNITKVTTRTLDEFYDRLSKTKAACKYGHTDNGNISPRTIWEVHNILRPAFRQAVIWGEVGKNPADNCVLEKPTTRNRSCWSKEEYEKAASFCDNLILLVCMHLSVSTTMRIGEITGLTWDNVYLTEESAHSNSSWLTVDKCLERVSLSAMEALDNKGVSTVIKPVMPNCSSRLVLKTTKTESSVRQIWIPDYCAQILLRLKAVQEADKALFGEYYEDYNLVIAQPNGRPHEGHTIGSAFRKLITGHGLRDVEFHTLRHTSITYKLLWSNGDVKSVQADSGHKEAKMVLDRYSHPIDSHRRQQTKLFNERFFGVEAQSEPEAAAQQIGEEEQALEFLKQNPQILQVLIGLQASSR